MASRSVGIGNPALPPATSNREGADLLTNITVGNQPTYASWDSRDDYLYVSNFGNPAYGGNTATIVAAGNSTPLGTYPVGDDPINTGYAPNTGLDYVLNFGLQSCNATVFNGTLKVGSVPAGCGEHAVSYDPFDGWMYISAMSSNLVSVVHGLTIVANLSIAARSGFSGSNPGFSVYDPADHYVYVPDTGTNLVTILNGTQFVANLTVGVTPTSAIYDAANGDVYVVNSGSNNVSILNGTTLVATAPGGGGPAFGTFDAADGYVYLADQATSSVFILNSTHEVGNISVGTTPRNAAYDPTRQLVYVTSWATNTVAVLNGTSLIATVSVGANPYSVMYDPATSSAYVCIYNANNIISKVGTPSGAFPVTFREQGLPSGENWTVGLGATNFTASAPGAMTVPEPNGTFGFSVPAVPGFVPSKSFGSVSVHSAATQVNVSFVPVYPITFTESGLPGGTTWSVTIAGITNTTANRSIALVEPNGTYNYSVGPVPGYQTTFRGQVTVAGGPAPVSVPFTATTYLVAFIGHGLPSGTTWGVSIDGTSNTTSFGIVTFRLGNGTYAYSVNPPAGYLPVPVQGNTTVNGSPDRVFIAFLRMYSVTFTESGLPGGEPWTVRLAFESGNSTGTTIGFELINGTYAYNITTGATGFLPHPARGEFNVTGGAVGLAVHFAPGPKNATYSVTFVASGLSGGASWSVHLGSLSNSSSGSTIGFMVPNGTFAYTVSAAGYTATPATGHVTVDGPGNVPAPLRVTFTVQHVSPTVYPVTFTASGLPLLTRWGIVLQGTTNTTDSLTIRRSLPDGNYTYGLVPVAGFISRSAGPFAVDSGAVNLTVAFAPFTYPVVFVESGLPAGTSWGVTVVPFPGPASGGQTLNGSAVSIQLREPNGTYNFTVGPVAGFQSSGGGSFQIAGRNVSVPTITFTSSVVAPGAGGLPIFELGVFGLVAAVVVAALAWALVRRRRGPAEPEPTEYPAEPGPDEAT